MKIAVAAALCVAVVACKHEQPASPVTDDASAPQATVASALDAAAVAPRCTVLPDARVAVLGFTQVVFGDAVVSGGRVFVGHTGSNLGVAQAAVESSDTRDAWVVAQGADVIADAPPPKPLAAGDALYAVSVLRGRADAGSSRAIALAKLGASAKVAPVASFVQHPDESFAFDAALAPDASRAAIAWDDDAGITLAVVPLAALQKGAALPSTTRVVSPDGADVESPRVLPRAGGFWVAWIERKPEGDASAPRVEGPAEDRAYAWVDLVALDSSGALVGALRRVTSLTGHVASFDLATRPGGELDVFARDETQAREASGGRVLHVVVRGEHVDDALVLVADSVGRGSVDVLASDSGDAWLAYFDRDDRARVAPLTDARALAAPPTEEPSLDGARLLAMVASGPSARFVAAAPSAGGGSPLRDVACAR